MDNHQVDDEIDLRSYLRILKARKWTIAVTTAVVLAIALTASYWQTPIYSATARVLVEPVGASTESTDGVPVVEVATESELLASEPVAERVAEELGLETPPTDLLKELVIVAVAESRVLEVTYNSSDPNLARDVANAFVESYMEHRREQAIEEVRAIQRSIQLEVQETSEELERLADEIAAAEEANDEASADAMENQRNILLAQLGVLQQQLNETGSEQSVLGGGEIVQAAERPEQPSSPNYYRNGVLATLLGVALGVLLALVRERLDDRFKGRDDLERSVGVPVLATVPWFGSRRKARGKSKASPVTLVTVAQPDSGPSEAYRSLRTNLQFITMQRETKSILITSAAAGEGKSVTSANLAVALAQAGKRTILVSADLRRPTLEKYFDIKRGDGLSSWLLNDDKDLGELIVNPGIPNLRVLPSGPFAPNPAELLTSIKVTRLIQTLEANCDYVIFDTPPVLAVADPSIIGSRVGGIILVLDALSTDKSAAIRAKQEMERAGGSLMGCVLNAFDPSSSPYHYYSGYSYYSSYPSTHSEQADGKRKADTGDASVENPRKAIFRR